MAQRYKICDLFGKDHPHIYPETGFPWKSYKEYEKQLENNPFILRAINKVISYGTSEEAKQLRNILGSPQEKGLYKLDINKYVMGDLRFQAFKSQLERKYPTYIDLIHKVDEFINNY